jgi:chromosome partitioning protein
MKVLVVDCDAQANCTSGLGMNPRKLSRSLYQVMILDQPISDIIVSTEMDNLYLAPSDKNLAGAIIELIDVDQRENVLKKRLSGIINDYDYILIDSPPAINLLTINALVAADTVLIPIQCEYFALEGVSELMDTLVRIQRGYNPKLGIEGLLLTMYDERTNLSRQVQEDLVGFFKEKVLDTVIPRNVRLAEAPSFGQPILLYDVRSRGANAYLSLAKELLNNEKESAR